MNVGIVGHEGAKFTPVTEAAARVVIRHLLEAEDSVVVSGHCHLGGIDIWAEEEGDKLGRQKKIFPAITYAWEQGYKPRNLAIAEFSDEVNCIVVDEFPEDYQGRRFAYCYHCDTDRHIKSGGCWTAKKARALGKVATWWVIFSDGTYRFYGEKGGWHPRGRIA